MNATETIILREIFHRRGPANAAGNRYASYDLFEWLGRTPTSAERMRFLRAVRQLHASGQLVICEDATETRIESLRLTPAGEAEARRLSGETSGPSGE